MLILDTDGHMGQFVCQDLHSIRYLKVGIYHYEDGAVIVELCEAVALLRQLIILNPRLPLYLAALPGIQVLKCLPHQRKRVIRKRTFHFQSRLSLF